MREFANDDSKSDFMAGTALIHHEDLPGGLYKEEAFAKISKFFIRYMHHDRPEIKNDFDMSRYLALSLDDILDDLIVFSNFSWVFTILTFAVFGIGNYAERHEVYDSY